jgi:integrase
MWEAYGAPKLDRHVPRLTPTRPRNVTATRQQIDELTAQATPTLRALLLICSDLAIRSGTAVQLGPEHYNPETRTLSFRTKKDARLTLAVTAAVREVIEGCDLNNNLPFLTQIRVKETNHKGTPQKHREVNPCTLRRELRDLRTRLQIDKRIVPHDLRRTSAVAMLRYTGDVRKVQALLGHRTLQSTIWYLDHDLNPVDTATLEAIKRPFLVSRKEHTA